MINLKRQFNAQSESDDKQIDQDLLDRTTERSKSKT